ncbi:MAG: OsmC family protein [Rhodospirillaceae bacterium]|nr:OsmC family protein [Rhodospirillaceae bacterium]
MTMAAEAQDTRINGLDLDALAEVVRQVQADPARGLVRFRVASAWKGQTRSEATVDSYTLGGQVIPRRFTIAADEPAELLGTNTAPNPQELLMAAVNACVMVGYVAGAAMHGITLSKLEIETQGELDLRGFLGLDPAVKPGYDALGYTVRIKGNGTPEQFREIHETVKKTSPNYFNLASPVRIDATLVVER